QPWDLKAEREGMRRLLNMGEVMDIAQVGYVITEAKLRDTPEAVRRVIRATNRGIGIVRDSSRSDDVAAVGARGMGVPPEDALRVVDSLRETFTATGLPTEAQVAAFLDVLKGAGVVPPTATVADMTDFTLAREVAQEMGLLAYTGGQ